MGQAHLLEHAVFTAVGFDVGVFRHRLLKFSMGQSVRKAGDEELRAQWIAYGTIADEEILEGSEIRWERRPIDNLLLASSVFHQIHDVVGYSGSISQADVGYNKSFRVNYFLDLSL